MRRLHVYIALALAASLVLPVAASTAPLSKRIETVRGKVKQKRYREHVLSETIALHNVRIRNLQGEIRGLQRRQENIQAELDERRADLLAVRDRLERARSRLAVLRGELREAEGALAARLVELYKADEPDMLTVVLEADGFGDLLERTEFLERISEQDQEVVGQVRVLKRRTTVQAKQLASLEREAERAANAILARRNEVAAVKGRLVRARSGIESARDSRRNVLTRVRQSRVRLEGDLRALEREQARVQSALRGAQPNAFTPRGGAGPIKRGSGRLVWPVNGPVVSPFGPRWGRLHAGIDIAVPSGTPIRAADSGRVVLLGWVGGYGNYVCIQHTGSLSTCYAHLSSFGTSQGASVSQGQVIGAVGCTGHCFGDHLHFETRVNGSPVDPMGHL